jgi:hypothetical protein
MQSDLFYDYRTNVEAYSRRQAWLQKNQPKLLVIWDKHDLSFAAGGFSGVVRMGVFLPCS